MTSYQPPPPYSEQEIEQPKRIENTTQFRINRKPLAPRTETKESKNGTLQSSGPKYLSQSDVKDVQPVLPPRPDLSLETSLPTSITNSDFYASPEDTRPGRPNAYVPTGQGSTSTTSSYPPTSASSLTTPQSTTSSQSSTTSALQKAYQEARHFAGGLITHPSESTKHFTILRHSHGLVFYQGSSTSLAISIFSDSPLPIDRTLWLQSKGWSGKTGMRAKAFMGRNGNWLNVTPTTPVGSEQLNPHDERAWQRDIAKFQKKAEPKIKERHKLRETAVVRIPPDAGDGYFQIVMCIGDNKKKVLCPSPVFRIISTSKSPSSIKGASLSTLPLEIGAKALSLYGSKTVGNMVSPVASAVQGRVQQYMPSWSVQKAAETVYGISGVEGKVHSTVGDANSRYDQVRDMSLAVAGTEELAIDQGPKPPYPLRFVGMSQAGRTDMVEELNMPNFNLTGVGEDITHKLHGYYFGWTRSLEKLPSGENAWCQAIISSTPIDLSQLTRIHVSHTSKKNISIRLITDPETIPPTTLLEILVFGFIRPDEPAQRARLEKGIREGDEDATEAAMLSEINDVQLAQEILDHPAWGPDAGKRPGLEEGKSGLKRVTDGYVDMRTKAIRQVDRVPLQKVGVRLESDKVRDRGVVGSGFFVIRG